MSYHFNIKSLKLSNHHTCTHTHTRICQCFLVIRSLPKIKNFLTFEQLRTALYGCVLSKLDYCNSLYYGINGYLSDKLQSVQNSAARLLKKKNTFNDLPTNDFIGKCRSQLTGSRAQPIVSRAQPIVSRAQPIVSRAQPTVSRAQPTVSRAQPTVSRAQSTASQRR